MNKFRLALKSVITFAAIGAAGCSGGSSEYSGGSAGPELGEAVLELTRAPTDALCLRVHAVGRRTEIRDIDLDPGGSTSFALNGLPTGQVTFSADAFDATCKKVKVGSVPPGSATRWWLRSSRTHPPRSR
jgi:hypothetical protein